MRKKSPHLRPSLDDVLRAAISSMYPKGIGVPINRLQKQVEGKSLGNPE